MPQTVLFLCTGNYYRSRFAEILFNALASESRLDWVADSRGLATELGILNVGPLSKHTINALQTRGIPLPAPLRDPLQLSDDDLHQAARIIALKEAEHRAFLRERYPGWEHRVTYWHVHDLDQAGPEQATAEIDRHVRALLDELRSAAPIVPK